MKEEWRPVVGREKEFEVSSLGRVRTRPRVLHPRVSQNGYAYVALGKGFARAVHAVVAEAFIGPRKKKREVRHLNGKRLDNKERNLKYGTRSENMKDAVRHGTWRRPNRWSK